MLTNERIRRHKEAIDLLNAQIEWLNGSKFEERTSTAFIIDETRRVIRLHEKLLEELKQR